MQFLVVALLGTACSGGATDGVGGEAAKVPAAATTTSSVGATGGSDPLESGSAATSTVVDNGSEASEDGEEHPTSTVVDAGEEHPTSTVVDTGEEHPTSTVVDTGEEYPTSTVVDAGEESPTSTVVDNGPAVVEDGDDHPTPAIAGDGPAGDDAYAVADAPMGPAGDLDEARQRYPLNVTGAVLAGRMEAPAGFDQCAVAGFGGARRGELLAGAIASGSENDVAARCLLEVGAVIAGVPSSAGSAGGSESGVLPPMGPGGDMDEARQRYPSNVTSAVLDGRIEAPAGFDQCAVAGLGGARRGELLAGAIASGPENDMAANCLLEVGAEISGGSAGGGFGGAEGSPNPQPGQRVGSGFIVEYPATNYRTAPGGTSGSFHAGQSADLVLSAIGFNDSGGPLLFNRPTGLSTDGTRLVMADTFNNRVLVWNQAPTGNQAPDLVLGQSNFTSNEPGTSLGGMNWPVSTSTDGTRLVVTDTYNNRILIWTAFPTRNGQPADIVLETPAGSDKEQLGIEWPWGSWTDGTRLVVTSTMGGRVLVWNTFPTSDDQPADLTLKGDGRIGTPRQVTSDGLTLMVGDHNSTADGPSSPGTFIWSTFPTTANQPYDFFRRDPTDPNGPWLRGAFAGDGRLVTMGSTLEVWPGMPSASDESPVLSVKGQKEPDGFDFGWSDFSSVAVVGERVYVTTGRNTVVGFDGIPDSVYGWPDFVVGGDDVLANTMAENHILSNPVPATDGTSLFVTSDFDKKLLVWKTIPEDSAAAPDIVYHFCTYRDPSYQGVTSCMSQLAPWDNALHGDVFAAAGKDRVVIWEGLPTDGSMPASDHEGGIGSITFTDLTGVAIDDRYFYLADKQANRVWIWEGLPDGDDEPVATLVVDTPTRLSSDGTYLAVNSYATSSATVYRIDDILQGGSPVVVSGSVNLPQAATIAGGHFFVADTGHNQVEIWWSLDDALAGRPSDLVLGADDRNEMVPELTRNQFFWPGAIAFDGTYLWVGEFKFSGRLLRFSPSG